MRLRNGLYVYLWESLTENNCNSYLVDGPVRTLIDPGHLHLLPELERRMAEDGFRLSDVHLAVATHPHPDHCEALPALQARGSRIAMHEEAEAFLTQFRAQWEAMTGKKVPAFRVDFHLRQGRLQLGSETFRVLETPGHAPGSICLYWEEEKALFSGDVIFVQSVGRVDLPGGNDALLLQSLDRLMELDVELLLPGHGPYLEGRGAVKENFYLVRNHFFGMV